jgi:hypothetical protein
MYFILCCYLHLIKHTNYEASHYELFFNCSFGGRPSNVAPPVFEQIFRNARFAQGGNALFEGKVRGIPKPVVSWTRKGAPLIGEKRIL